MRYIPLIEHNIMASNFSLGVSCVALFLSFMCHAAQMCFLCCAGQGLVLFANLALYIILFYRFCVIAFITSDPPLQMIFKNLTLESWSILFSPYQSKLCSMAAQIVVCGCGQSSSWLEVDTALLGRFSFQFLSWSYSVLAIISSKFATW
jgi:hypothetical protein